MYKTSAIKCPWPWQRFDELCTYIVPNISSSVRIHKFTKGNGMSHLVAWCYNSQDGVREEPRKKANETKLKHL